VSCPSFPGCASAPVELLSIAGTAPTEDAYFILEQAKPWPAKIKKMDGVISDIRSVLKKNRGEDVRLVATPEIPWLEKSARPRGLLIRWDGQRALCLKVEASKEALSRALAGPPSGEARELYLVCTHGSRDPCCGLLGVPLFQTLTESSPRATLQVSHLGGHRFAPVIAAFPEWRFFGHLTSDTALELDSALQAERPYLTGYRGHGRLQAHLQVVEAALWEKHGCKLRQVRQIDGEKALLKVEAVLHDDSIELYEAELAGFQYEGYKSCKDFRNGKCSDLKLFRLKRLSRCG
jgi:hypothetical protein